LDEPSPRQVPSGLRTVTAGRTRSVVGPTDEETGSAGLRPTAAAPADECQSGPRVLDTSPRDFDGLREWLHARDWGGIVWHRNPGGPDTDMALLKRKDFPRVSR
jgi:hypothetical protein